MSQRPKAHEFPNDLSKYDEPEIIGLTKEAHEYVQELEGSDDDDSEDELPIR
jgi:hypothetical protein